MKRILLYNLLLISLILSTKTFAQDKDITGLWKGRLYNDSTKLYYPYELAISESKGKYTGYSETIFNDSGREEIGIKSVKIKMKDDNIIIEDVDLIDNNFSMAPPKHIRKVCILTLTVKDTVMKMTGTWLTNRTKIYLPASGTMEISRKSDFKASPFIKKLDDLKLTEKLSFVPQAIPTEPIAKNDPPKPKPAPVVVKKEVKEKPSKPAPEKPAPSVTPPPPPPVVKQSPPTPPPAPVVIAPAAELAKRKTAQMQSVYFTSDSLTLSLYDNGYVDGDTVSVVMNGKVIFSKQGLTTKANSKTVQITKDMSDSIMLVMYAENLGEIPPNTGLMVIHDGDQTYEVHFTADLETNAAIILKRKKPTK